MVNTLIHMKNLSYQLVNSLWFTIVCCVVQSTQQRDIVSNEYLLNEHEVFKALGVGRVFQPPLTVLLGLLLLLLFQPLGWQGGSHSEDLRILPHRELILLPDKRHVLLLQTDRHPQQEAHAAKKDRKSLFYISYDTER